VDRNEVLAYLQAKPELLRALKLIGASGRSDSRQSSKLEEVAGFVAVILRCVRLYLAKKKHLEILECSCGKGYLGFALVQLLQEREGKTAALSGVDSNPALTDWCRSAARVLGMEQAEFVCSRTARFQSSRLFDLVISLHACDTATDETIAKGVELAAPLVLVVPCCQNQIRGQIKSGHPLTAMTDFGPIRYQLANLLTDSLRAQFLYSAGYHVEIDEIGSPKLTPKNLCICAHKSKRARKGARDRNYKALKDFFGVKLKLEELCPGIVQKDEGQVEKSTS
jgi:hypothetical protein